MTELVDDSTLHNSRSVQSTTTSNKFPSLYHTNTNNTIDNINNPNTTQNINTKDSNKNIESNDADEDVHKEATTNVTYIELPIKLNQEDKETSETSNMQQNIAFLMGDGKSNPTEFPNPQAIDYIQCATDDHQMQSCNVVKRIVHLLAYYGQNTQNQSNTITSMHDYIMLLKNYNTSMLMEDWHQMRINHLGNEESYNWIRNEINIDCSTTKCANMRRHHRQRENANVIVTDVNNVILMDLLDSIHVYIFHSMHRMHPKRFISMDHTEIKEEKYEITLEDKDDIWWNKPTSIQQCNIEQIVCIINYIFTNHFIQKVSNQLDKLICHQKDIIEFIKRNKYNGNKFCQTKRKEFASEIKKHLSDSKLVGALLFLHKSIITYDLRTVWGNIWRNKPQSVQECNVAQIVCVSQHIISNNDKLFPFKKTIIQYLRENQFNGSKMLTIQRKQFIKQLAELMNNNKLKPAVAKLRKDILEYDLAIFTGNVSSSNVSSSNVSSNKPINKFVTETHLPNNDSKAQYYSFGTQYRYTKNLKNHPLYVKPKYATIKDELYEYFKRINQEHDLDLLLESQSNAILTINPDLHQYIKNQQVVNAEVLWINDDMDYKYNEMIATLMNNETQSSIQLTEIIEDLCSHLFITENFNNQFMNDKNLFGDLWSNARLWLINSPDLIQLQDNNKIFVLPPTHPLLVHLLDMEFNKMQQIYRERLTQIQHKEKEIFRNISLPTAMELYKLIFDDNYLKLYSLSKSSIKEKIKKHQDSINYNFEKYRVQQISVQTLIEVFGEIFTISKREFYLTAVQSKFKEIPSMNFVAQSWAGQPIDIEQKEMNDMDIDYILNILSDIFSYDVIQNVEPDTVKSMFIQSAHETIQILLEANRNLYLEQQQQERSAPFIQQAQLKLNMNSVRQLRACWYQGINQHHNIHPEQSMQQPHVLSLVLYTQCTELCTTFRETYRKLPSEQSIFDQITRHSIFAHLGRLLYESFVFYGSKESKIETLYTGISMPLLFKTLYCTFDSPTSTTTAESVACSFGGDNGIILKLEGCESTKYIKTLDMGLFTCFHNEDEQLIFETRLHIKDIFMPSSAQFIGKRLMNIFSLYDLLIHGNYIQEAKLLTQKNQKALLKLIQSAMNSEISSYTRSSYVNSLIRTLIEQNNKIWLNVEQIQLLNNQDLKCMFIQQNKEDFGEFVQYLKSKFAAIVCPIFMTEWKMNQHTFNFITRTLEDTTKHINVVVVGPTIKCELSEGKSVSFQPQLTKVQDLFDVEMKFISTYNNLPIKVHFNVECKEMKDYYASLHPRLMDVKWNNTFHVTLPTLDNISSGTASNTKCCGTSQDESNSVKPISISISIMFHNSEEFSSSHTDVNTTNSMILTDMRTSAISYTIPDILSNFYGISNSVISVLDSISDILFILFLYSFDEFQTHDSYQFGKTDTEQIIDFLLILCIWNLISVAIVIAIFISAKSEITSFWKKNLLRLILFILSPCLPAFQWVMYKFQSYQVDVLMLSPGTDPKLLWFEQELIRNRTFIIETIIESCFQVVIQFMSVFVLQTAQYQQGYLYLSITISLLVIISKFILICYNPRNSSIYWNLLCYSMDMFFSLFFGLFIAAFVFDKLLTFIGLYMIFELITVIPLFAYYIASLLSFNKWLFVPFLLVFCYPISILVLSGFSIYPLLTYLLTNPYQIGRKQMFHRQLYEYCCDSKNNNEFKLKMVVINYVSIRSYFNVLNEDDDQKYFEFAHALYNTIPSRLGYFRLNASVHNMNEYWYSKKATIRIINVKIVQFLIRTMLIPLCVLLDIFYTDIFYSGSVFMVKYGNVTAALSIVGIILFVTWILLLIKHRFISKWETFCFSMIATKHDSFVLLTTIEDFINECDQVLAQNDITNVACSHERLLSWRRLVIHTDDDVDDSSSRGISICVVLQSTIILAFLVWTMQHRSSEYCSNQNIIFVHFISTAVIIFISSILLWMMDRNTTCVLLRAIIFSSFISQTIVYIYTVYFYEQQLCIYDMPWIFILLMEFIGALISITKWFCLLSIIPILFSFYYLIPAFKIPVMDLGIRNHTQTAEERWITLIILCICTVIIWYLLSKILWWFFICDNAPRLKQYTTRALKPIKARAEESRRRQKSENAGVERQTPEEHQFQICKIPRSLRMCFTTCVVAAAINTTSLMILQTLKISGAIIGNICLIPIIAIFFQRIGLHLFFILRLHYSLGATQFGIKHIWGLTILIVLCELLSICYLVLVIATTADCCAYGTIATASLPAVIQDIFWMILLDWLFLSRLKAAVRAQSKFSGSSTRNLHKANVKKARANYKLLYLMYKLSCLFIAAVIITVFGYIVAIFSGLSIAMVSIDSIGSTGLLFMSFQFNDVYFRKLFCGCLRLQGRYLGFEYVRQMELHFAGKKQERWQTKSWQNQNTQQNTDLKSSAEQQYLINEKIIEEEQTNHVLYNINENMDKEKFAE
eukprot:113031_1